MGQSSIGILRPSAPGTSWSTFFWNRSHRGERTGPRSAVQMSGRRLGGRCRSGHHRFPTLRGVSQLTNEGRAVRTVIGHAISGDHRAWKRDSGSIVPEVNQAWPASSSRGPTWSGEARGGELWTVRVGRRRCFGTKLGRSGALQDPRAPTSPTATAFPAERVRPRARRRPRGRPRYRRGGSQRGSGRRMVAPCRRTDVWTNRSARQ